MSEPLKDRSDTQFPKLQSSGPVRASKEDRYRQAAALLNRWMTDDDGYDDSIWPLVGEELTGARMRCRE